MEANEEDGVTPEETQPIQVLKKKKGKSRAAKTKSKHRRSEFDDSYMSMTLTKGFFKANKSLEDKCVKAVPKSFLN